MKCNLVLQMHVSVVGSSEEFQEDASNNAYVVQLHIPLTTDVVEGVITTNTVTADSKVLAVGTGTGASVFRVMALILMIGGALFGVELICFIYLTRNTDITYELRVSRLVKAYKSFIQKITNDFDTAGYQILFLESFQAMLEIRDTIQSPILMHENEDRTCTRFLIPTNTKILYVYEIKVEDYDEIYKEEPVIEEPIILEEVDNEALAEALASPDIDLDAVEYIEDDDKEEEVGVEVIGVVWPEKAHRNKVYRYDPNGEELEKGDEVLVPSRDVAKNKDIIRKAAVAHGNHKVDPETLKHPLKKIIGVVKRKAESVLTPKDEDNE